MANKDFTYCNGKWCGLRSQCRRYLDGQRIIASNDDEQYYWMDHCDPEIRDGYINQL